MPTTTQQTDVATADPVAQLEAQIAQDPLLSDFISASLGLAITRAKLKLNPQLFQDLSPWPLLVSNYLAYLTRFLQLVPSESQGTAAWTNPESGYSQEVYDRLCQFYWLIDQRVPPGYNILQNYSKGSFVFGDWLDQYASAWGNFLNTPASLTDASLKSFWNDPAYCVGDSSSYVKQWKCFNDFFARKLNPGLRPITSPLRNTIITAPADCTFRQTFPIDQDGNIPTITLKKTHTVASIAELLKNPDLAKNFYGGTFVHYFLTPYNYHRFHAPVSGTVRESKTIVAQAYLGVEIDENGQFNAPDSADATPSGDGNSGYEFEQTRGVLVIDTSTQPDPKQNIGMVGVVPVGMAQVSSVTMKPQAGQKISKGDEFGYFKFGGSDIILLFQANQKLGLVTVDTDKKTPFSFRVGNAVAYWNADQS